MEADLASIRNIDFPDRVMRRGWVEDKIKNSPFGGNALIAEGMRQDLYNKLYEDRMASGEKQMQQLQQLRGEETQRIIDENTKLRLEYTNSLNGRPNYEASRSKKRRQQPARTLAYLR